MATVWSEATATTPIDDLLGRRPSHNSPAPIATMSASSPSQANTPPVTNTTASSQQDAARRRRRQRHHHSNNNSNKSPRCAYTSPDESSLDFTGRGDVGNYQNDNDDKDKDNNHLDDRMVTIRIQTNAQSDSPSKSSSSSSSSSKDEKHTTVWTCPYSLLEQRELEMQRAAQTFGISSTRWSASLIFNRVCLEMAKSSSSSTSRGNLDIVLTPSMNGLMQQYQPSDGDKATESQPPSTSAWPPWLTNLILGYYETGQLVVPNACQGQDLLLALEYFAILYAPDQLVFESYNAYQRVRIWSEYLTQRALLAEWVEQSIVGATQQSDQQQQQQYVFYFGTAANPQERLRAGPKAMPLSIFHGQASESNNNMCRVVYRLFNPSHENQVSEELCLDFCRFLQQILSTTRHTGERTIVQAQFAVKMIHVETLYTDKKKSKKKISTSSLEDNEYQTHQEERAVLKVLVQVERDDSIFEDDYQQLKSEATNSIQSPYTSNDQNLKRQQEKVMAVTTRTSHVDSSSAFTPQAQAVEETTIQERRRPLSPCISIISTHSQPSSPPSIGSGSNRSILKYKQPIETTTAATATTATNTTPAVAARSTPSGIKSELSHPMDEKSNFTAHWSESMGPPPLLATHQKKNMLNVNNSGSPKDATTDIYNATNGAADAGPPPKPPKQEELHLSAKGNRRRKASRRKGGNADPQQKSPRPPPSHPPPASTTDAIDTPPSPTKLDPVFGPDGKLLNAAIPVPSGTEAAVAAGASATAKGNTTETGNGTEAAAATATAAGESAAAKDNTATPTPNGAEAASAAAVGESAVAKDKKTKTANGSLAKMAQKAPIAVIGTDKLDVQTVASALTGPFVTSGGSALLMPPQLEEQQQQQHQQQQQQQQQQPEQSEPSSQREHEPQAQQPKQDPPDNLTDTKTSFESSSGKESEEVRAQAIHHEWVQGSFLNRDISTRVRELLKAEEERNKRAAAAAAAAAEEVEAGGSAALETQMAPKVSTPKPSDDGGKVGGATRARQPKKSNRIHLRADQVQYDRKLTYKDRRRKGYRVTEDDEMPPKAMEVSSAESSATTEEDPSTVATVEGSITEAGCDSHWDWLFNYVCELGSECIQPIDASDCGGEAVSSKRSKRSQLSQRSQQSQRTGRPRMRREKEEGCLSELPDLEKTGMPTHFHNGCEYFKSLKHANCRDASDDESGSDSLSNSLREVPQQAPKPKALQSRAGAGAQRDHAQSERQREPKTSKMMKKKKSRNAQDEKEQQLQQKTREEQDKRHHGQQPQQEGENGSSVKHYLRQIVQQQLDEPTQEDKKFTRPQWTKRTTPSRRNGGSLRSRNSSPARVQATTSGHHKQQQTNRRPSSRGRGIVGGGGQSGGGLFRKMASTKKGMESGKEAVPALSTTGAVKVSKSATSSKGFRFWKKKSVT